MPVCLLSWLNETPKQTAENGPRKGGHLSLSCQKNIDQTVSDFQLVQVENNTELHNIVAYLLPYSF